MTCCTHRVSEAFSMLKPALPGTAIYWLHSKSPSTPVTCTSCTISPADSGAIATEAIALQFLVSPPTAVQSNEVRSLAPSAVRPCKHYNG